MSAAAAGTFAIEGEMTIYRAAELCAGMQAALGSGCFAMDLSAVTEIDSAGVQLLLAARKSARAKQRELELTGCSAPVAEALGLLGLDTGLAAAKEPA